MTIVQNRRQIKTFYRIGLDLDNTLISSKVGAIKTAAQNLGITEKYIHYDYHFSGWPEDLRSEIYRLFEDPEFMGDMTPLPGAVKKLKQWKDEGHSLIIITARNPPVHEITKDLVAKYFPMVDKLLFVKMTDSKQPLFKQEQIDVWIDDSASGIQSAIDMGIKSCLISNSDTPYNWKDRKNLTASVYELVASINF